MDKIVPDYDINTGNVKFSVKTKRYPESQEVTEKPIYDIEYYRKDKYASTRNKLDQGIL